MRFSGKTALVTGGAKGIGFATARRFAEEGANVALIDIDGAGVKSAEEELRNLGVNTLQVVADAGNAAQIRDAVALVIDTFGGIDIAVAGAG